jgi:hypothetical protein
LADYAWPWVAGPFRRALQQFEPDVVILEYITMAYLIDMASPQQRERTVWAVDTHDCLAERARQFQAAGHSHWLAVTAEEEIAALEPADVVIAIQAQEAAWFAQRLRRPRVVVAQHAPPVVTRSPVVAGPSVVAAGESGDAPPAGPAIQAAVPPGSRPLVVGFIASNNVPNRCGIQEWLLQVGGSLGGLPIQLIFAGSICDDLQARLTRGELKSTALPPLQLLGTIGSLPDFYRRCDVVVNPVAWGTGLKIKTIEALAFHRPVLASEHAGSHLEAIESGVLTCRDPQSWIDCLQTLATRPEQLERLQHQARNYARRALSPAAVYGDLAQQLQQLSQQKKAEPTQS